MKRILASLALCAVAVAQAGGLNGQSLHDLLRSNDASKQGLAVGYIAGVYDTNKGLAHCGPETIDAQVSTHLIDDYLNANPQVLKLPADLLVMLVFSNKWPCKHEAQPQADKPVAPRPPRASSVS